MTTSSTVTINEIPVDSTDPTKTAWGAALSAQYYFAIANGTDAAETFDAADIGAATQTRMATYGRGISVNMGGGDDTVTGSAYGDTINAGAGTNRVDGGDNQGQWPGGAAERDVLNVFADTQAAADALSVTALDAAASGADGEAYAAGYRIKVSNGAETDYLKNVEQVNVFVAADGGGYSYAKTVELAVNVIEADASGDVSNNLDMAWAIGTGFDDSFNAATDVSAATSALMDQHQRGVWADMGAGDDTVVGSGYGDDISVGAGTNYVDGGANAGTTPWGSQAQDVLHVTVASQAAADAVQVVQLDAAASGTDKQAFDNGYTYKIVAGAETDYVKGIERVSVQVAAGGSTTWARDIALAVSVREANLADSSSANYYHLAWVDGTAGSDTIDLSSGTTLLSTGLQAAMDTRGRGVWVDGGAGDDIITGTGYADNFRNGAGNARIDGGANAGPDGQHGMDVFEITVATTAEMAAVQVSASDDPAYQWMVTYGSGSSQKDYLKNVEAITVNVAGTASGKWIPLAVSVNEIPASGDLAGSMHYAWAQGTAQDDSFSVASDVSAATRALMDQHQRGVWVDLGAGNDTVTGSAYGDDISVGAGTNYVDGGANDGSAPWGGKARDVLHVTVADQAAADAVQVSALASGMSGADAQAFADGYTHKVVAGAEIDYVKGVELVSVQVGSADGGATWARDIQLAVVVQEANLADAGAAYYHLAWVNGTGGSDNIDLSGDTALLSPELKAAMASRGRGVWVDGGAGDDTITGTGYADNFRNGAGNARIDGGANAGPNGDKGMDVFEISVASAAEMSAVQVVASDDPAYQWMVTYGSGSTQKDYLKNIEGISINVAGTATGRWIALAMTVNEIDASGDLANAMHYAWVQGTGQDDSFNAATDVSSTTRGLMDQHQRGVWVDLGAGNDTVTGSGYGDDISVGAGINRVDGGANAGMTPWNAHAADTLHVTVADNAAAAAVQVTALTSGMSGADADAYAAGYTFKVSAGAETDYIKNIERVTVQVATPDGGSTYVRDIALAVTVQELNLSAPGSSDSSTMAWVSGTAGDDAIDLSGDTPLLSAGLKTAMASAKHGVFVDGGAGNDTITGTAYGDYFRNGAGNSKIDGGANAAAAGHKAMDIFEVSVATVAELNAVKVLPSDDPAYQWMVTYGSGSTQKDYLKNIEGVSIFESGSGTGKWVPLVMTVTEVGAGDNLANLPQFAWAQGTSLDETFNAATDVSAGTQALMTQYGRGVYVDLGAGNDTITGSGYGDVITAGSGTNFVDGGANAGTMPGGAAGQDVLDMYVASQAEADAVTVTTLAAGMSGADASAFAAGYTLKIANGSAEVDYVRDVEQLRIHVWQDKNGNGQRDYANPGDAANEVTLARVVDLSGKVPVPNTAPSFSGVPQGVAVSDFGADFGAMRAVALASGKLLTLSYGEAAAGDNYMLYVTRANADGSVDTSFGGGSGRVALPTSYSTVAAPVELAGGKLLVALSTYGSTADFKVLRLNADGSPDASFGTGGAATVSLGSGNDSLRSMLVDAAGNIVLVGNSQGETSRDVAVVRLNAQGALDASFNGSGKLTIPLGTGTSVANAVALQADGKLVLAGYAPVANSTANQLAVVRVNQDGTLDTSFGSGGKVLMPIGPGANLANAVKVLADGKILLGGYAKTGADASTDWDQALVRLNANGSVDASFGSNGVVTTHLTNANDNLIAMKVQADGKILTLSESGYDSHSMHGVVAVTRYNADGTIDTGFGEGGVARVNVHGVSEQPAALALVGDKIVVFGSSVNDGNYNTSNFILRLNANGQLDTSFGANPSSLGATVAGDGIHPVALDANAAIYDAELAKAGNYGGATLTLARHGGANADDVFLPVGEVSVANGSLMVAGAAIGTVSQAGGTLTVAFNDSATQGLVNRALHGIGYTNASGTPPASVTLDWTFSDANTGAQGTGGALTASGSSTVNIGMQVRETYVSLLDASTTPNGTALSLLTYLADVRGTNAGESFDSATGFSQAQRALMDQYQHGASFDMGGGDDTVVGTGYGDTFVGGSGTNRIDGGGQAGTMHGTPSKDVLNVYATSQAEADAVRITMLDASASGADQQAFAAGYTVKVVNGAEIDYLKNVEQVVVSRWNDNNGNGVRDPGETSFVREQTTVLRVNEVVVSASDPSQDSGGNPLAQSWHFAWANGWSGNDSFDANTDVSAATRALMDQYGRGVWASMGDGNDTVVGSSYGDSFELGRGTNHADGGANNGTTPDGAPARDEVNVYLTPADGAVSTTQLVSGMSDTTDAAAYAAGYTWKIMAGAEIDYVKNIEVVNVWNWNDANANGQRDSNEVSWQTRIPFAMIVDEVGVSPTDPTQSNGGTPLSQFFQMAWAYGGDEDDNFSVAANVSAGTRALMATYKAGVMVSSGAGNDVLAGSSWSDTFDAGAGVNKIDGGDNLPGNASGIPARDALEIYVSSQADADAVSKIDLTAGMSGADGQAYAEGYRYKFVAGDQTDYVKNIEDVRVLVWNDLNHNGQRDYGDSAHPEANEVSWGKGFDLAPNAAPSFSGAPAGVALIRAGYDFTPTGMTTMADGRVLALSLMNQVASGYNYTSVLSLHSAADGTLDGGFGLGGKVELGVYFGNLIAAPVVLGDGKVLMAVSTSLAPDADFKVVRLNPNGSVDSSFGTNGATVVSLSAGADTPSGLLVQGDGKIVLTGTANGGSASDMAVVRLTADGALDNSFAGSGSLVLPVATGMDRAYASLLQADGKLVLAGSAAGTDNVDFAVARLLGDGTLDSSFGNGGKLVLPVGAGVDSAAAVALAPDGSIVLAGSTTLSGTDLDVAITRLTANGSLDTSFGNGGKVVLHQSDAIDRAQYVLVQGDGKIVTAGFSGGTFNGGALTITRLNLDGTLDASFGQNGVVALTLQGVDNRAAGLAQVGGKLVVMGVSSFDTNADASMALVRLNDDGSLDTSYGNQYDSSIDDSVRADGLHPAVLAFNGALFDAELNASNNYSGASLHLARSAGASADDVFVGTGEVSFAGNTLTVDGTAIGTVEQAGGSLVLHFGDGASQGLVNRALHGIAYLNTNASPPSSVALEWSLQDPQGGTAYTSSTVQLGLTVAEEVRSYVDPTLNASHVKLDSLAYLAKVSGSLHGETFNATAALSSQALNLMASLQRGADIQTHGGGDTVVGTGYGDHFVMGSGVNHVDGGANAGTDTSGAAAADVLEVFVADPAAADAVQVVALNAQSSGDDLAAFNAGYLFKVASGSETDYLKNVENVQVTVWNDANGNHLQDSGELTLVKLVGMPGA